MSNVQRAQVLFLSFQCGGFVFRVRGLIRLVRKGMETHLSCQIQLCALLASKRGEIFHFPHFSVRLFFFFFFLNHLHPFFFFSPLSLLCPLVYPILSTFLMLCSCFLFFLFPVGVVEGHCAHWLTFREKRGGRGETRQEKKGQGRTVRIAEEGEGQPGGQAVHSTVQSSLFASDMIGEVWKDTWGYRLSENAKGVNSVRCHTSDPRLTSPDMEGSIPSPPALGSSLSDSARSARHELNQGSSECAFCNIIAVFDAQ